VWLLLCVSVTSGGISKEQRPSKWLPKVLKCVSEPKMNKKKNLQWPTSKPLLNGCEREGTSIIRWTKIKLKAQGNVQKYSYTRVVLEGESAKINCKSRMLSALFCQLNSKPMSAGQTFGVRV